MNGLLYLLPCELADTDPATYLTGVLREKLLSLQHFVAEEPRTARRFLAKLGRSGLREVAVETLNEHTAASDLPALLVPLREGADLGLISEAGCPAVADPGANLVALAHREGIRVVPLVGPSSLLLALMASGLGGQNFSFHGYLPVPPDVRRAALQELEQRSAQGEGTQLFIETPYRNAAMLQDLLLVCRPDTLLCLATDLTAPTESVVTRSVAQWRATVLPEIDRRPTVFLLLAVAGASASPGLRRGIAIRPVSHPRRNGGQSARRNSRGG